MKNNRVLRALSQAIQWIATASALVALIAWLQSYFKFSRLESIMLFAVLGIGLLVYLLVIAGNDLTSIKNKLDTGFSELSKKLEEGGSKDQQNADPPDNPDTPSSEWQEIPSERKPEPKPSGGGAFAGMVAGGALGAAAGPIGVIIGGIIGALIGNQIEYENIQKKEQGK
jgi:hypothetical protein